MANQECPVLPHYIYAKRLHIELPSPKKPAFRAANSTHRLKKHEIIDKIGITNKLFSYSCDY